MGRLLNGINSPIVGKVGTVVGSSRNGKPYLKSAYKERTKKVSKRELGNRNKFSEAQYWLKPLLEFVREGFKIYSRQSGAFVAAKSHLLLNAFEGVKPDIRINPALVKVSVGELPLSPDIAVKKIADDKLQFTWDTSIPEGAGPKDQIMMLAYDIDNEDAYFTVTGQFRDTGADTLGLAGVGGRTYHIYAAFTAADRSKQSESVYLGEITIPAAKKAGKK